MEIRNAFPDEADTLSALALAAKAHWGYSAETVATWTRELSVSVDDIASKPTFVAEVEGQIAGFYCLRPSSRAWEFDHLWVRPSFMRRGIGRALVTHALEAAARNGAASVIVDADPNAEVFYLACGATRFGAIPAPIPGQPGRVRPQLEFPARG